MDSGTRRHSSFLSHLYSVISCACLYWTNLDGFNSFGMYSVEEKALLLVFGLLSDSVAEKCSVTNQSPSPPVVIELGERGTKFGSRPWPPQSGVETPTLLPRLEDNVVLYMKECQRVKGCDSKNNNAAKEQEEAHSKSRGRNCGNQA